MGNINGVMDETWSSVERTYSYDKVVWEMQKNGIPKFSLYMDDEKIR